MKKILTIVFFLFFCHYSSAYKLVNVLKETITVNSTSSLSGSSRNYSEISLPAGTVSYIYRISVFKRNKVSVSNSLFGVLSEIPIPNLYKAGVDLSKYAIENSNGHAIDVFTFTNQNDASQFYNKTDREENGDKIESCERLLNIVSTCREELMYINRNIWFGFRNNNMTEGLDVCLEVIAIVDEQMNSKGKYNYGFLITSKLDKEVTFFISDDNINWKKVTLSPKYRNNYVFQKTKIYVKVGTKGKGEIVKEISYNNKYSLKYDEEEGRVKVYVDK